MQKIYIVPHTHWDREWYFTTQQSQVLLIEAMDVILEELENNNLPYFVLDGQSVMLEDFFDILPQQYERVRQNVQAGKLQIGPWYTQTDQCVVAAESLVRNLLYGTRDCKDLGGHLDIGYVPDSFGQTEQLPQLFNQFGIRRAVFWRGLSDSISTKSEFRWRSRDGSEVTTAVIQHGYAGVKGMPGDDEVHERRMQQINSLADGMRRFNVTDHTLVMGGNDQQPWDPRLPEILREENARQTDRQYQLASMQQFFTQLEHNTQLTQVTAEMLAGQYSRIHRGIYSTRYDIKKANADIETLITHQLEPLLSIAWSLGMSYPHGLIEKAWKLIMQSHAHDSIGCCNTDPVNASVKKRFVDAMSLCQQQLDIRKRQIAQAVKACQQGDKIVVFNTLPETRNELISAEVVVPQNVYDQFTVIDRNGDELPFQIIHSETVGLGALVQDLAAALKPGQTGEPLFHRYQLLVQAGELPALGYKTFYLQYDANNTKAQAAKSAITADTDNRQEDTDNSQKNRIENQHLTVTLNDDGTITLTDKQAQQSMSGLLELVDGGDDGDNYDFSAPRNDWLISTRGQKPQWRVETGPLRCTMSLDYQLSVPADLPERAAKISSVALPVSVRLMLDNNARTVEVEIDVDNRAKDHRLQLVFRTGLATDASFADQPFGTIKRASRPVELDEWESQHWTSKPLALYPMQSFAALNDGVCGLAVITDGIREYQVDGNNTGDLSVTLFRSVGRMGKPDLLYRPGRLSGMGTETPDSQLQQALQFRLSLFLHQGNVIEAGVAKQAKRFLTPMQTFHDSGYNRFSINASRLTLPDQYTLASFSSSLVVSAVKKAEDAPALLLRAFNPDFAPVNAGSLTVPAFPEAVLHHSTLAETCAKQITNSNDLGMVQAQQVVTYWIDGVSAS